jgi:hypothetical protein
MTSVRVMQRVSFCLICHYDRCKSSYGQVTCALQCTVLLQE